MKQSTHQNDSRNMDSYWQHSPGISSNKIIAPSILSADFSNLETEVKKIAEAGADWVHVDVMDGHFVPNLTIGIPVVESLNRVSPLPLDVHLMIEAPERYIESFAQAGADLITIHVESTQKVSQCLKMIKNLGVKSGITLRPKTSLDLIVPYLDEVDLVLIMTVEPGFGGQSFMVDQVQKIQSLRKEILKQNHPILIEVDGGINETTSKQCLDADVFVAGSYVFKGDYQKAISSLKTTSIK